MKILSLWMDFHHKKGLEEIRIYEYLAKEIPSGLSICSLDKDGNIDGKSRRIPTFSDTLIPNYTHEEIFTFTGRLWCKPDQMEEAKEFLLDGLKVYMLDVIDKYSIRLRNLNTKLSEL